MNILRVLTLWHCRLTHSEMSMYISIEVTIVGKDGYCRANPRTHNLRFGCAIGIDKEGTPVYLTSDYTTAGSADESQKIKFDERFEEGATYRITK